MRQAKFVHSDNLSYFFIFLFFIYLFIYLFIFSGKKSLAKQTIHMKCQDLFSL